LERSWAKLFRALYIKIDIYLAGIVHLALANQNSINLKLSILLIVILAFAARETLAYFWGKVTVTIINDVRPVSTPTNITLHCKSKDNDLGFHTLEFGGNYMFSFKPTLIPWETTLFFCSFTWLGSPYLHYFVIYDFKRDDCKNCKWKINKLGGCKYLRETGSFDVCSSWSSVKLMDANNTSKM